LCARGGTWGSKKLAKKSALLAKIPAP
jgi:hypothetical protein